MADAPRPIVLIVRDGWGRNPHPEHDTFNAVKLAATPSGDALLQRYPSTLIKTCGEEVGLASGTVGNSEVGHQNLGAGRIVDQDSMRITRAIREGTFHENEALTDAARAAAARGGTVHLLCLASDAGVHSRLDHLYACLEVVKRAGRGNAAVHLFTDGRDTGPFSGRGFVRQVEARCREIGVGRVATLCGRYFAMDRDNRWERVERAYRLLTEPQSAESFPDADAAVGAYYDRPVNDSQAGDEFIGPRRIGDPVPVGDGDAVIFCNFRGDRPRELTRAFMQPDFFGGVTPSPETGVRGFERPRHLDIRYVCMTAYDETFAAFDNLAVAFPKPPKLSGIAGEYLAGAGRRQFRSAETEKFPHVTFFFNDYREQPFPGESRRMAQSPRVPTYDLQPEMSAPAIRDIVLGRLAADDCEDFILVNFANPDMVGHTGKLGAAINAVETVDGCVGAIVEATLGRGGRLIVTADHGNAEQMWDPDTNAPHTAHTLYDVECIVVDPSLDKNTPLRNDGRLADVFPTVLKMMRLEKPGAMTGESLL